jgi:hypothetical protein
MTESIYAAAMRIKDAEEWKTLLIQTATSGTLADLELVEDALKISEESLDVKIERLLSS